MRQVRVEELKTKADQEKTIHREKVKSWSGAFLAKVVEAFMLSQRGVPAGKMAFLNFLDDHFLFHRRPPYSNRVVRETFTYTEIYQFYLQTYEQYDSRYGPLGLKERENNKEELSGAAKSYTTNDPSKENSGYNGGVIEGETGRFIETTGLSESNKIANHYQHNRIESIIKYERAYGTLAVMVFCEINADKYRDRIGKKEGQDVDQELYKIKTYENAASFFCNKLGTDEEVKIDNYKTERFTWQAK